MRRAVNRLFLKSKALFVSGFFAFFFFWRGDEFFSDYFSFNLPPMRQPMAVAYRLSSLSFGTSAFEIPNCSSSSLSRLIKLTSARLYKYNIMELY